MKLPKKITPCPIIESIIELRFDSEMPSDAIFGVIYSSFKELFPNKPENLPILQMPAQIRNNDPNLLYRPHYRLSDDTFLFQIGPKAISLIRKGEYVGWSVFSPKIKECCKKLKESNVIKETKRFGLRYINFFEDLNIYEKTNLKLLLNEDSLTNNKIILRTSLPREKFICDLRVSNDSKLTLDNVEKLGSVIDIDVNQKENGKSIIDQFDTILEEAHNIEKELFFGLLEKEFLKNFSPEY